MELHNKSFLLVEDDELDAEAFRRSVRKCNLDVDLRFATDGNEALKVLRECSSSSAVEDPVVILDLNMPGMNGHEFLEELRADPDLRGTIVFVLTSSDHQRDIQMAYDRNVSGYFLKSEINVLMTTIAHYVRGDEYSPEPAR